MPAIEQHIAIGLAHRMGHQFVAYCAAIYIEVLQVSLAAREGRQPDPAPQVQAIALDLDGHCLFQERRAAHRRHTPGPGSVVAGFVQIENGFAVVAQIERYIKASQRQALDHFLQVVKLGFFGLEKLAPRRGVEKQVAHFNRGTHRVGRRLHPRGHVAAFGFNLPGLIGATGARRQGQAGHGADGSQCFTAKAQAHHPFKVFKVTNLAGGVTRQGQRQVVAGNPAAVVAHPQQLDPGLFNVHIDTFGPRVEAVFQQFLDHRRRALNHLTCCNLVGQARAEQFDPRTAAQYIVTHY
jgi:hypothetical protein